MEAQSASMFVYKKKSAHIQLNAFQNKHSV